MEGGLEKDKQDVHVAEANAQNAYELAKKARDHALSAAKDNKKEKEDINADKGSELAKAETDLASEQEMLVGDSATLDSTDQECKQVQDGYKQRTGIRSNEITAMEMAMKILSKVSGVRNPDTHEIPGKASMLRMHVDQGMQTLADRVDPTVDQKLISFLQLETPKEKA